MEYLQKCFYKTTAWNEDNIYANVTATSRALLDFPIPSGGKLDVTSQATEHLASSMTLLNHNTIHGSLAYLYSSVALRNTAGTKDISLQDALAGFRIIEPHLPGLEGKSDKKAAGFKHSLLYGRLYFPGSSLEAMLIRRLSELTQLLIKCVNNPHLYNNGTMIVYLQKNVPRYSREYIYSTTEALFGFRCLYNFGTPAKASLAPIPKFDNSVVSVGAELWFAARSMSPGLLTALRYSTRSTSTGKPLTMTLSCNPILGHISSTYNVKTSVSSTVCSKYDFNWFSYASNLSIGFELYNFSKSSGVFTPHEEDHHTERTLHPSIHLDTLAPPPAADPALLGASSSNHELTYGLTKTRHKRIVNPIPSVDDYRHMDPYLIKGSGHDFEAHTVMKKFQNLVKESNFSSVLKGAASLSDRTMKLLWVGRYKDFLVSTGVGVGLSKTTQKPEVGQFGITFSYAC